MSSEWSGYYQRTQQLPAPERVAPFLAHIPTHGRLLDFGAGAGRWTAAFHRDRPDVVIDALDRNIAEASLIPESLVGERIKSSFQAYQPVVQYDAIWAFAVLFFLSRTDLQACLKQLSSALKPGGIMQFSMVDACDAAQAQGLHGVEQGEMLRMLERVGLVPMAPAHSNISHYGVQQIPIPTYYMRVRKASACSR